MSNNITIREAISIVKTELKKINADNRLTNKQIFSELKKHGEWLIDRDSNSFKLSRREIKFQVYNCANVIEVPKIDSCCNISSKCTTYRTENKIPEIYEDSNGIIYKEITSVDSSTEIKHSTLSDYKIKKDNPWGVKSDKFWFYSNGYIYGDLPKKIRIVALFKDDIALHNDCEKNCKDCPKVKCISYLDTIWTVPSYLQAQIIDFAVKSLAPSLSIPTQEKIDKNENKV